MCVCAFMYTCFDIYVYLCTERERERSMYLPISSGGILEVDATIATNSRALTTRTPTKNDGNSHIVLPLQRSPKAPLKGAPVLWKQPSASATGAQKGFLNLAILGSLRIARSIRLPHQPRVLRRIEA